MVNVDKLRGKIAERRFSIKGFAEELDMDASTFYRKLQTDGNSFSIGDVDKMIHVLGMTKEEANNIFFAQFVA